MKLINNSENNLCHSIGDKFYLLEVGKVLDVPKEVADAWLKYEGVAIHVDAEDIEKAKAKAVEEALKAEKEKQEKEKQAKAKQSKEKKSK